MERLREGGRGRERYRERQRRKGEREKGRKGERHIVGTERLS